MRTMDLFQIPTRVHNETGFWGPVDAVHQFCEPHYSTTYFAAEFYNGLSSIVFVLTAWHCYRTLPQTTNKDMVWIRGLCGWLGLIGVGSILFHLTMRRTSQFLDEGPMIFFMANSIMGKVQMHPYTQRYANVWRVFVAIGSLVLLWVYAVLEAYEVFVHGFTGLIALEVVGGVYFYSRGESHHAIGALVYIIVSRLVWESEQRLCETYPQIWPFHVIFHCLACRSAYHWLQFNRSLVALQKEKI